MIRETDIAVIFNPNTLQGSRSLGYGQINILGIIISYSVYPSNFGLGFMVSYPSKPSIKNGVQELDQNGKPKYFKEVYIQNIELRNMIDNAVQNAMANKGVYVGQTAQAAQQAGFVTQQPPAYQQPQQSAPHPAMSPQFAQPQQTFNSPATQPQTSFAPPQSAQTSFAQPQQAQFAPPPPVAPAPPQVQPVLNTQQQPLTTVYQQNASSSATPSSPGSSLVCDDDLPF